MAINKVIYGADTLVDLTEDTVTAEDVLNSKSFHTPDGVKRTGTASYPVTDVQVNGTSVMDGTVANVEQPTADEKTATDEFNTANGGLLSKCVIDLVPIQSGSGDPYPAGGGKNKLPMVLADIKARNTSGTWSGNVYTINNVTFTVLTDDGENITGIKVNGTASADISFLYGNQLTLGSDGYILTGCPSGGSTNTYMQGWNVSGYPAYVDTGSGYTVSSNLYGIARYVGISIINGTAISNLTFYPMIRLATETDPTFAPYSNVRPISGHTEVDLYNVGKNRLPLDISTIKSINTSGTWNGNVYTINGGTFEVLTDNANNVIGINVNGTFNATTTLVIIPNTSDNNFVGEILNCSDVANENQSISLQYFNGTTYVNYYILQNSTDNYTITNAGNKVQIMVRIASGQTVNNRVFKPMIRLATDTDTTFEPYLGHLYTVQIGSTVYGGYVDLVSGVMRVDRAKYTLTAVTLQSTTRFYVYVTDSLKANGYIISDKIDNSSSANTRVYINSLGAVTFITETEYASDNDFMTAYGGSIDVCAELATPQTIQLTPQQIEALPNQNNFSTPLDGQSIETNGVEYKELFTFADVKEYVKPLIPYSNAGSHNAIYRGKYLGNHVTPEQWASIVAGTFDDLFIGDYWTINSVNWRIAHFDYWLGTGDTECADHHVVVVPDTNLYSAKMNSTDTTTGGYYNSEMRGGANYLVSGSSNLYSASETIKSAFGSSHILTHREALTNAVSSDNASGWAWHDSSVDLMSEAMVYGILVWSSGGKGYEVGDGKGQLALFRHDISKATNRTYWWLRGVVSTADFAYINRYGTAAYDSASNSRGVRPCFAIK